MPALYLTAAQPVLKTKGGRLNRHSPRQTARWNREHELGRDYLNPQPKRLEIGQ
jgi:hypothetical protein